MSNLVDKAKAITAEDLIRRYNLGNLAKDRKAINVLSDGLTKLNAHTEDFVKAVTKNLDELQDQVDGNITTWFFSGVPSTDNAPAVDWTTDDEKNNHLGDLYYDQDTGYAYRWGQYEGTYSWLRITDNDVTKALALANSAKDAADSKRRTFYDEPTPPYDSGDIWIYKGEIYRCIRSRQSGVWNTEDWVNDLIYTDDTVANKAIEGLNEFSEEVKRDYVTNKVLEETAESFRSEVKSVQVKVDKKNTIFKATPVPPYIVGDLYIENGKIYVCTTARAEGKYNSNDWKLSLDKQEFASKTQFEQTSEQLSTLASKTTTMETDVSEALSSASSALDIASENQQSLETTDKTLQSLKENSVDKNQMQKFEEEISTRFTQQYNAFQFDFNDQKKLLSDIQKKVDENISATTKYIRFEDGAIILGQSESPMKVRITNTEIQFLQNDQKIAYLSNNTLYITNSIALTSIKIGNFQFTAKTDGSLSFGKVGG